MKRFSLVHLVTSLFLIALLASPFSGRVSAQGTPPQGGLEVIVQTDGSPQALAGQIQELGGQVEFVYENVPAMVVSLPAGQEGALAGLPGVVSVEKDRLVYLADDQPVTQEMEAFPTAIAVENQDGVAITAVDPASPGKTPLPSGYVNFTITDADRVWEQTGYGSGSVVAVVDTGTAPNICLAQAVIGAPGYPDGFNATGDGIPANAPQNHWHGTHVGGVIASACALDFSSIPDHPLYQAVSTFLPWAIDFVPVFGQAPLAQIYPVKVFDTSGGGTPVSVVLKGLDHVLTLKKSGQLDIDVVNLSLSGPTLFDGRDAFDRFIKELNDARITVVSSASNYGPLPNTIGSPATSFSSIAVGALDYARPSRVLYEYQGLISGYGSGQGLIMRPTREARVANFSARGPLSDGRAGVDLSALGAGTFYAGPLNELRWASGTSFSAPAVSGVVALLNAYYEAQRSRDSSPQTIRDALLLGVDRWAVGKVWRGMQNQGYGALDAEQALRKLVKGERLLGYPPKSGRLSANILDRPVRGQTEVYTGDPFSLRPGQKLDAIFGVSQHTSRVIIEVAEISARDNRAIALRPNTLEVYVQSAIRSAVPPSLAFNWQPNRDGSGFTILVEDGPWSLNGEARGYQPMQPGLMKVTLAGRSTNGSSVRLRLRVTRENLREPLRNPLAHGEIEAGDSILIPVTIAAGVSRATFDLTWTRNWTRFPPSDIDMVILDPGRQVVSAAGATLNAPERAVVEQPAAGEWLVQIQAAEMYFPDTYKLYLRTD